MAGTKLLWGGGGCPTIRPHCNFAALTDFLYSISMLWSRHSCAPDAPPHTFVTDAIVAVYLFYCNFRWLKMVIRKFEDRTKFFQESLKKHLFFGPRRRFYGAAADQNWPARHHTMTSAHGSTEKWSSGYMASLLNPYGQDLICLIKLSMTEKYGVFCRDDKC